jgi:hypothetical protein
MSKAIDSLDTVAQAAGFAMVGCDDNFHPIAKAPPAQSDDLTAKSRAVGELARSWLQQIAVAKPHLSIGAGWSPWKATA